MNGFCICKKILSHGVSLKKVSSCEKRNELGSLMIEGLSGTPLPILPLSASPPPPRGLYHLLQKGIPKPFEREI